MVSFFHEWVELFFRWLHIITAISWIGTSFYFMWLDNNLRNHGTLNSNANGESWLVHGGGFYHIQKYFVSPKGMPKELHWFKWESYATWISGFCLLAIIYYWEADTFLVNKNIQNIRPSIAILISISSLALGWFLYDIACKLLRRSSAVLLAAILIFLIILAAYGFGLVFSQRAAFLHTGAILATIMSANVFCVIIPNQKKVVRSLVEGEKPDPILGQISKLRSTHNNYITLPVLFIMISNHYPFLYDHDHQWLVIAIVLVLGGIIRNFFNLRNSGIVGIKLWWQWPLATGLAFFLIFVTAGNLNLNSVSGRAVTTPEAVVIIRTHCTGCHARVPSDPAFDRAAGGISFEDIETVKAYSKEIFSQAVLSKVMPMGDSSSMTEDERLRLGLWIRLGMPDD